MFLPEICIRRPVTATVIVILLVIFGLIGMGRIGVMLYPDVDFPVVSVSTIWQNARPEEVDNNVTDVLEDSLGGIEGTKHIVSDSYQGVSRITLEFELYKDVDVAAQEVRDKTSTKLFELPDDAEFPIVEKIDINAQPVLWLALYGQRSIEQMTDYADRMIKPAIQRLRGVGDVVIYGQEREVKIWLNRDRLATYNIGVDQVLQAVRSQHVDIPGGKVESPDKEFLIRTMGEFPTETAFNDLIVTYRDGTPIRIKNIGYAEAGREDLYSEARFFSGDIPHKSVAIGVAPRSGANEVAMANLVKKELEQVRKDLPPGLTLDVSSDSSVFTQESIDEVEFQLILGGIMAAVVVLLFLNNLRTALFSSLAIPTSIISAFGIIYACGFTLNNLTMLALVSATGLVIDDSIIMEENIYRHRFGLGKSAMGAALDGSREIGFAVIAATLTLTGVFLPVAFMGGIVGKFFKEFALTMAFAIACSMLVALTIEPMLASRFLKPMGENWIVFRGFNSLMQTGTKAYRRYLAWLLNHNLVVVLIILASVMLGAAFFLLLDREFVTADDQSQFMIMLEAPLSYSIYRTDETVKEAEKLIQEIPEVANYFALSGVSSGGETGANKGLIYVTLVPKDQRDRTQSQIMAIVREKIKQIPDLQGLVSEIGITGGASRDEDIQFVIQGSNLEELDRFSREIMARMAGTPGFVDMDRSLELEKPEIRVNIDRNKAADLGIDARTVSETVGALVGGIDVVEFKSGGESYDVRLRLLQTERALPTDVNRIWMHTQKGETVDLASIVKIETGVGPSVINRMDRQRAVIVYSNLDTTRLKLGQATKILDAIIADVVPQGYKTMYVGRSEAFRETGAYIAFAFMLAVVLTYLVLAAQFESFIHPFSIMMSLPFSFVGAFGMLLLTGNSFNLFSMIAMVLLVGLPTKNGILLVDRTNQLRRQGLSLNEAIVEAAGTRLRPILMTAVSTMAGVIPVALGIGVGAESRQAMGTAITGGLLSSTFLTLILVPIVYSWLDRFTRLKLFSSLKKRIWVQGDEETERTKVKDVLS